MHENDQAINSIIKNVVEEGILPNMIINDTVAYIQDPVFSIVRNRVTAECLKTLIRCYKTEEQYVSLMKKMIMYLASQQNLDGSWNEIHVKYNEPSALITSIVGGAFIDGYTELGMEHLKSSILKAKEYVTGSMIEPGYYKKSTVYTADHLNVDATCGAFLAKYASIFSDDECRGAALAVVTHICDNLFPTGAIPYTTHAKGNYPYNMNVPCIHYQGVTLYYLLKIIKTLDVHIREKDIDKAIYWLKSVQKSDGKFDWSQSGLMFAYYLSGAYAFSVPSFRYEGTKDGDYIYAEKKSLHMLHNNITTLANRWEKDSYTGLPYSLVVALRSALLGVHPIKHKLFRFGYGTYRQISRRRYATSANYFLFSTLTRIMHINTSTIEPSNNFPDLFMSSEVLDCLSYTITQYPLRNCDTHEASCT
jgi:hypothetical protein